MKNPVASKKHYRLYVIHKLPQLRLLDFRKVRQKVFYKCLFYFIFFLFDALPYNSTEIIISSVNSQTYAFHLAPERAVKFSP